MEDERIVGLYLSRDQEAIRETAAKYGRLCRGVAYNILGDEGDAEECVNDTWLGVWNAIPPARPRNLTAFVCGVARNLALKRLEFRSREKRSPGATVPLEELKEVLPDDRFAQGVSEGEVGALISQFLRGQREEVRDVFIRRYYYFDSLEEIAARHAFTRNKVRNMLFRTRSKLRDYLIKEGVEI